MTYNVKAHWSHPQIFYDRSNFGEPQLALLTLKQESSRV